MSQEHWKKTQADISEKDFQEQLELLIVNYRAGVKPFVLVKIIEMLSLDWDRREFPCRIPHHKRQDQKNPHTGDMLDEIIERHEINPDWKQWTDGEKMIVRMALS